MPDVDLSDLAEFKELGRRNQRKPCGVAEAAAQAGKDGPRVLAAFESDDADIRRGAKRWLKNREVEPPNDSAISHHRSERCACHA